MSIRMLFLKPEIHVRAYASICKNRCPKKCQNTLQNEFTYDSARLGIARRKVIDICTAGAQKQGTAIVRGTKDSPSPGVDMASLKRAPKHVGREAWSCAVSEWEGHPVDSDCENG